MSKKKFKKNLKAKIHQQLQAISSQPSIPEKKIAETSVAKVIEPPKQKISTSAKINAQSTDEDYSYVKNDLKKIALIYGILLLVLAGIYILSLKTGYVVDISNWLTKILHLA